MKKPIKTIVMARLLAAFLAVFLLPAAAGAESNVGVGGSTSVQLEFEIEIPTILFLRIGSAGAGSIDTVEFDVGNIPEEQPVVNNTTPAVTVQVGAIVGSSNSVVLQANSASPLTDGANTIPFSTISWTGSVDFVSGTFGGTTADLIASFTGPGLRQGEFDFSYDNDYYPPGLYTGTVTYTLSSP
jgi:hypothetical protein